MLSIFSIYVAFTVVTFHNSFLSLGELLWKRDRRGRQGLEVDTGRSPAQWSQWGQGPRARGGAGHGSRLQPAVRGHASPPSLCHVIGTLCTS